MRQRGAAPGLAPVEGLGEIKVEGLARRHAEVEAVAGNGFANGLGLLAQHRAGASEDGIACGRGRNRRFAEQPGRRPGLLQRRRGGREERGGEEFQLAVVVGLDDLPAQTGGAVALAPLLRVGIPLAIQREALHRQLGAIVPIRRAPDYFPFALDRQPFARAIE